MKLKSANQAILDYVDKFHGEFPCGCPVLSNFSNVMVSVETKRGKKTRRVRCLDCHRSVARKSMRKRRKAEMASAKAKRR